MYLLPMIWVWGALSLLGWLVPSASAGPVWYRVETANFQLYSDAGPEEADRRIQELEGFRALLVEQYPELIEGSGLLQGARKTPLSVLVFSGHEEYEQFVSPVPPRRKGARARGMYQLDGPRPLVAMDASRWDDSVSDLHRSYVEALLDRRPRAPPWMLVGLSEFYATAQIEDRARGLKATLGRPAEDNLALLRDEKWIRLEEVIAADWTSPLLRNPRRRAMFEAEAWLLVHWCLLDPDHKRQALLARLTSPTQRARGIDPLAFDSLGAGVANQRDWLTEALTAYLQAGQFGTIDKDLSWVGEVTRSEVARVPPVEVEYRLGQVLAAERQFEQAEVMFQHALGLDVTSWMPHDGLGLLAQAANGRGARRSFAQAVALGATSAGPYLDYGKASMVGLRGKTALSNARSAFEKVIALDPSLLDAYAGLAELSYRQRDWTESARWAGRGLQIDPRDSRLRAMLGRAQYAVGDLAHARVNTQLALQECEDQRSCAEAAALVRVVLSRL